MSDFTSTVLVEGMTCGHCVASVSEEIGEIAEVSGVEVELVVGGASRVTIASSAPITAPRIQAAVEEAGYAIVEEPVASAEGGASA
ncbi:heavy-metal-associated domain-containing protein [Schumannella sp. 10F1B-5-1]|uniref:heavy-metal-associated domain-containing protein n=1 Tax=Schumannella sp. 10F1B-5-1 TaxID=2590780 RepID=UPI001131B3F9|nr:cation transporter [Schumannella sp. 10F1B-5-1]TPW72859.1 heavy-metal-associated domain-containing protein [Schumannella sp. 10F1B-5-1]